MFTGIITHLGRLVKVQKTVYTFSAPLSFCKRITKGTSIAVNGVCLTTFKKKEDQFSIEIMPETAKKTMVQTLRQNDLVNLELPVSPFSFLSGHLVAGHVDGVGKIGKVKKEGNSRMLTIYYPKNLGKYITQKGSIAVNGISLTVIDVERNSFTVGIIPYTWQNTMLKTAKMGDPVNIEVDIVAKYVEKLLQRE